MILLVLLLIIICVFISIFLLYFNTKKNIVIKIDDFYTELKQINNTYICHSLYIALKKKYRSLYDVSVKYKSKYIFDFCKYYEHLKSNISVLNSKYIEIEKTINEEYFANLCDYKLDDSQLNAIIIDDDYNLVIAGAGTGKTSTMIAKIKYLIDKKKVNAKEILAISFTNNAVDNFKKKLNNDDVDCMTFHKLGLSILSSNKLNIGDLTLDNVVNKYFHKEIYSNMHSMMEFLVFFAYHLHLPFDEKENSKLGDKINYEKGFDFQTLKSKYFNYEQKKDVLISLNQEKVRSYEELIIANYLFMNGVDYEYETPYHHDKEINYKPDFYLKEYDIYLEHFGVNKDFKCPQYDEFEEKKYIESINYKRQIHKKNNTVMLETYSYFFSDNSILKKLDKLLKQNKIKTKNIDVEKVYKCIVSEKNSIEVESFKTVIKKFINLYKGNNFDSNKFADFYDAEINKNDRSRILLKIIEEVYLLYQEELVRSEQIDFNDMINLASAEVFNKGHYKKLSYIIIDEFQDISFSRYLLLKNIIDSTGAKLIAVGDDYQSIFRFSGCDLELFINFNKYFPAAKKIFLNYTYRNSQELIDVAHSFIMKNRDGQIDKKLLSNKHLKFPIEVYYYNNDNFMWESLNKMINKLKEFGCVKIAILGRNKTDILKVLPVDKCNFKIGNYVDLQLLFDFPVEYYTIHASKGKEFDGVIVCNLRNNVAGFPNKMADDLILDNVALIKDNYVYEEERRLFYVALTRTKTKCLLLAPVINHSVFIDEIVEFSDDVFIDVTGVADIVDNPTCPVCRTGRLLIRENKKNNTKFVSCSNYPSCTFSSNFLDIINDKVQCPRCNHFLVKKAGKNGLFYGCTNFPNCTQTAKIEE